MTTIACAPRLTRQRRGQPGEIPQVQVHQRDDEEQRKRGVADHLDAARRQPEPAEVVIDVADRRAHQHGTDVTGQGQPQRAQAAADPAADDRGAGSFEASFAMVPDTAHEAPVAGLRLPARFQIRGYP